MTASPTTGSTEAGYPADLLPRLVIRGPVKIESYRDCICIGPIGSRNDYLTVTFKPATRVTTGCFSGSLDDFREEVAGKGSPHREEYEAALLFIEALETKRGGSG